MLGQGRSDKNAATRSFSTKPLLLSQLGDSENVFVDLSLTPRAMRVVWNEHLKNRISDLSDHLEDKEIITRTRLMSTGLMSKQVIHFYRDSQ